MTSQETKEFAITETSLAALKELMHLFENSTADEMRFSVSGFSLELVRSKYAGEGYAAEAAVRKKEEDREEKQEGLFLTTPVVGTYYAAAAPENPPFVAAGDRVKKGQTVCMIEAMKMLSEIPAPCDCIIEKILKADGELAEYGEALFRYRPC